MGLASKVLAGKPQRLHLGVGRQARTNKREKNNERAGLVRPSYYTHHLEVQPGPLFTLTAFPRAGYAGGSVTQKECVLGNQLSVRCITGDSSTEVASDFARWHHTDGQPEGVGCSSRAVCTRGG
jgi:hypothetical protein